MKITHKYIVELYLEGLLQNLEIKKEINSIYTNAVIDSFCNNNMKLLKRAKNFSISFNTSHFDNDNITQSITCDFWKLASVITICEEVSFMKYLKYFYKSLFNKIKIPNEYLTSSEFTMEFYSGITDYFTTEIKKIKTDENKLDCSGGTFEYVGIKDK